MAKIYQFPSNTKPALTGSANEQGSVVKQGSADRQGSAISFDRARFSPEQNPSVDLGTATIPTNNAAARGLQIFRELLKLGAELAQSVKGPSKGEELLSKIVSKPSDVEIRDEIAKHNAALKISPETLRALQKRLN